MLLAAALAMTLGFQKGTDYCKAELVSSVKRASPGKAFWLGVRFKLSPGWHVYWRNPGDAGAKISVKWTLPKGWQVGEIQWPLPHRIPGDIPTFGYMASVTLLAKVKPSGAGGTINASIDSLVCSDRICLPCKQVASKTISVGAESDDPAARGLSAILAGLPTQLAPSKAKAQIVGKDVVVSAQVPAGLYTFYPYVATLIDHSASQTQSRVNGWVQIRVKKSDYFETPRRVQGLFVLNGGSSAYAFDVPVKS